MPKLFTYCLFLLFPFFLHAQSPLDQAIDFSIKDQPISTALLKLSQTSSVSIVFKSHYFEESQKVNIEARNRPFKSVLSEILQGTGVTFRMERNGIILIPRPKRKYQLSGYVEDAESGERLILATVYEVNSGKGTVTNDYGFFTLELTDGEVEIQTAYLGYQSDRQVFTLSKNSRIKLRLQPSLTLSEVLVSDKNLPQAHRNFLIGRGNGYNMEEVKIQPSLAGEADIFRHLQTQPGVQSGSDGFGGLHVRGGNADQNLVLLDGVPVYSPSHTLGLFSVFNTMTVKSVRLLKDGFSARYGGRLSSVLDVRTREGNTERFSFEGEIGTLATKAVLESPLAKGKGGFLLSARRTHIDPWVRNFSRREKEQNFNEGESQYSFHDINGKVHFGLGENDRLYFSIYHGGDDFEDDTSWEEEIYDERYGDAWAQRIDYGNTVLSLRWNHLFSDSNVPEKFGLTNFLSGKLFSNTTLTFSEFRYVSQNSNYYFEETYFDFYDESYYTRFQSTIQDVGLRNDYEFIPSERHLIRFGTGGLLRNFEPGSIEVRDSFFDENLSIDEISELVVDDFLPLNLSAWEVYAYAEDEFRISEKWQLLGGLRMVWFFTEGHRHQSLQPRLALEYQSGKKWGAGLGLSRMTQFLHVVTTSGSGFPNDLWVPSTERVGPQHALQAAAHLTYGFDEKWSAKGEVFYKKLDGLVAYEEDAGLPSLFEIDAIFWEDEITVGEGWSYGAEAQIRRTSGRTTGYLSYAWTQSERQFPNINEGKKYPFRFTHEHSLNIQLAHQFSDKIRLSLGWEFGSGQPQTLVVTEFPFAPLDNLSPTPTERRGSVNGHRLPAYHRLDVNVLYAWGNEQFQHRLNFGIYNIYNRRNPYYQYYLEDEIFPEFSGLQSQNGLPLLPTVGYGIKF